MVCWIVGMVWLVHSDGWGELVGRVVPPSIIIKLTANQDLCPTVSSPLILQYIHLPFPFSIVLYFFIACSSFSSFFISIISLLSSKFFYLFYFKSYIIFNLHFFRTFLTVLLISLSLTPLQFILLICPSSSICLLFSFSALLLFQLSSIYLLFTHLPFFL